MALHLKATGIDYTDFSDATESSELFDDYEEGTFTPSSTNCTFSGGDLAGRYTKVGDLVTIWFDMTGTISSASSNPEIAGLPFTAAPAVGTAYGYGAPQFRASNAMNSDFRAYGSSSYHAPGSIVLLSYNSGGIEGSAGWQGGTGKRITGWTTFFTAT